MFFCCQRIVARALAAYRNSFQSIGRLGESGVEKKTHNTRQHTTTRDIGFLRCFQAETSCWRPFVMLTHREPRGGDSDDSDSGFGTNAERRNGLAESQHHTAPRGPKMAMARGERYELNHNGEVPEALLPQLELFSLFEAEPGGSRPQRQGEPPGPQVGFCGAPWSRWPTSAPSCRCSMILCRRRGWGILLLEVYRTLDLDVPEQATDVPKSTQDGIQQRLVDQDLRQAQMAEQLVEMPEFVQFASVVPGILVEVLKVSSRTGINGFFLSGSLLPLWGRHLKGFSDFSPIKKVQSPAASAEMTRQVEFPR